MKANIPAADIFTPETLGKIRQSQQFSLENWGNIQLGIYCYLKKGSCIRDIYCILINLSPENMQPVNLCALLTPRASFNPAEHSRAAVTIGITAKTPLEHETAASSLPNSNANHDTPRSRSAHSDYASAQWKHDSSACSTNRCPDLKRRSVSVEPRPSHGIFSVVLGFCATLFNVTRENSVCTCLLLIWPM